MAPVAPRVYLFHARPAELPGCAARLRAAGYQVIADPPAPATLRALRGRPPAVAVIDLSRVPSAGRDLALALRSYKDLRAMPLVFVEGEPDKVARVKKLLPDGIYAPWSRIRSALRRALAHPPKPAAVPLSRMAGYEGAPLAKKLGIGEATVVALHGAPPDFERTLGRLPAGAKLRRSGRGRRDPTLWFVRGRAELAKGVGRMAAFAGNGRLWILWPKKAASPDSGLTWKVVDGAGVAAGLVSYKVSRIDDRWTALRFTCGKGGRARGKG